MSPPDQAGFRQYAEAAVEFLRGEGLEFAAGLSADEIESAEAEFAISFPPDLRALLETSLPVGPQFPRWRGGDEAEIRKSLEWPLESILFDVNNGIWSGSWGARPVDDEPARQQVRNLIDEAPKLVPVFSHRYISGDPNDFGNPVFSVYQTDTIIYGVDLADYLRNEFGVPNPFESPEQARRIEFWSELVDFNNE